MNYFILKDVIHGRPVIEEMSDVSMGDLEMELHPDAIKKQARCVFLDIQIEDPNLNFEQNNEIQFLSEILDISIDALEEIVTDQRPRLDDYLDFVLILFKSVDKHPAEIDEKVETQVGLKIYDNVVISLHLGVPMPIAKVFRVFARNSPLLIQGGITYLATRYIDALIDPIYGVLDEWRKVSRLMEKEILQEPDKNNMELLLGIRQSLFDTIKIAQADREVLNRMRSAKMPLFQNDYIPPELDDHIRHLLDESDILRATISDLMNMFFSAESAKLNKVLARFTFFTSLLLLPTLISGIFGMNNVGFPEIHFGWVLVIMAISMGWLFIVFRKNKLI